MRKAEVEAGTWRNPALTDEAREKLSRPRKHADNPTLHSAIEKLRQGTPVADLTPAEQEAHRTYRRQLRLGIHPTWQLMGLEHTLPRSHDFTPVMWDGSELTLHYLATRKFSCFPPTLVYGGQTSAEACIVTGKCKPISTGDLNHPRMMCACVARWKWNVKACNSSARNWPLMLTLRPFVQKSPPQATHRPVASRQRPSRMAPPRAVAPSPSSVKPQEAAQAIAAALPTGDIENKSDVAREWQERLGVSYRISIRYVDAAIDLRNDFAKESGD